jgi:hypothetical protein
MKFSAWGRQDPEGTTYAFIEGDRLPADYPEPDLRLLEVFEAESWNDAMRQYHEWQGWEPYKPMDDSVS